ncbi:hypothetical protein GDO81_010674 [Engystomops pustulosus]|uniref:Interleukin-4 n=1 Tax=Engystomops pustulosus TaxID=76066 RepID=A0AAV7C2Q0_ENGPU|nr:hypothetical protein GDO81_010674 [Engystomops pustulosus]
MKISLCLIVLALSAFKAYSKPVSCLLVQEGSFILSRKIFSDASLKKFELSTPTDESYKSFECVKVYYEGLSQLQNKTSDIQKLTAILRTMNLTKHKGECRHEICTSEKFFEKLKMFLTSLTRNNICK